MKTKRTCSVFTWAGVRDITEQGVCRTACYIGKFNMGMKLNYFEEIKSSLKPGDVYVEH